MRFRTSEEIRRTFNEFAYRVRIFDPRGQYPAFQFASPGALYSASRECVYTVTWSKRHDQLAGELPYSEMDWATPEELRFWASILLCEDIEGPLVILYPNFSTYILDAESLDLTDASVQNEIRLLLSQQATEPCHPRRRGPLQAWWNAGYDLFSEDYHAYRQPAFDAGISASEHCLLRGVSCLIKCDMLSRHHEFCEEAGLLAFIALDASYSLVLDLLRLQGHKNPSAKDAGRWLDDTFNRPIGIDPGERRYFEEDYEKRIMTMHPSSRFGVALYAPFIHDDYMWLRRDLREIFAYLVLKQHGPEMERRLRERARFGPLSPVGKNE